MIKLKNILLEMTDKNFEYAYHSGPRKITKKNIIFDISSLGFHVGTMDQAQWVSSGKTGKGVVKNGLPISKFKVFEVVGNLYMTTIEHDMAWEHADVLLVELVHEGEINVEDAHKIIDSWDNLDLEPEQIDELHRLVNRASRAFGNLNFNPMDEFQEINLSSFVYKNHEKLSQIRKLLVNQYNIGAIKYKNEVEGNQRGYSICVLDESMIQDA